MRDSTAGRPHIAERASVLNGVFGVRPQ